MELRFQCNWELVKKMRPAPKLPPFSGSPSLFLFPSRFDDGGGGGDVVLLVVVVVVVYCFAMWMPSWRACWAMTASAMARAAMPSTMGTARGTTQGSWRPFAARTPSPEAS